MSVNRSRQSTVVDGIISFPRLECWNPMNNVATVAAEVNKRRILCRISLEILREKFAASDDNPMQSVVLHRAEIQEAARRLIEREQFEEDGSVVIRALDV
ncbi:MAG: DUF1488 family protein [Thiotrichales bacterium]